MARARAYALAAVMLAAWMVLGVTVRAAPVPNNARKFTVVSVQIGRTMFWLPSTIVVRQGDHVRLTLKNEVPGESVHGFTIPAYHIREVVKHGDIKNIGFVADKPGIFRYFCQLHPGHIGGQLIVEPRGAFAGKVSAKGTPGSASSEEGSK